MKFAALALCLVACSHKPAARAADVPPPTAEQVAYRAASNELTQDFVDGGTWVVSTDGNGDAAHQGDALLWSGTALWALPCALGDGIEAGLIEVITRRGGALVRYEPGTDDVSMDGALGLFLGVSRRVTDCGKADLWRAPIAKLLAYENAWQGRINEHASARLIAEFTYVRDLLAAKLDDAGAPDASRQATLETEIGEWMQAIRLAHVLHHGSEACYRANLSLDAMLAIETLGGTVSGPGRQAFCAPTASFDIPTVDHYCGRKSLLDYVASFVPNQWEFRHQRCAYEGADGNGLRTPGLDLLVAYVMAYGYKGLNPP